MNKIAKTGKPPVVKTSKVTRNPTKVTMKRAKGEKGEAWSAAIMS